MSKRSLHVSANPLASLNDIPLNLKSSLMVSSQFSVIFLVSFPIRNSIIQVITWLALLFLPIRTTIPVHFNLLLLIVLSTSSSPVRFHSLIRYFITPSEIENSPQPRLLATSSIFCHCYWPCLRSVQ